MIVSVEDAALIIWFIATVGILVYEISDWVQEKRMYRGR